VTNIKQIIYTNWNHKTKCTGGTVVFLKDIPYDNRHMRNGTAGTHWVIDHAYRKIVVVDVNGFHVPFYLSTGEGGKKETTPGKWYPFFGIGKDGWINKDGLMQNGPNMANYYNSPHLKTIAEHLDHVVGDIREARNMPFGREDGPHIGFINQDMITPVHEIDGSSRAPGDLGTIRANIKRVLAHLEQSDLTPSADPATQTIPSGTKKPDEEEGTGLVKIYRRMAPPNGVSPRPIGKNALTRQGQDHAPDGPHLRR
jgi:hypothetical protein